MKRLNCVFLLLLAHPIISCAPVQKKTEVSGSEDKTNPEDKTLAELDTTELEARNMELGLIEASKAGNSSEVLKLLSKGVNIDAFDNEGYTILMRAAIDGNTDVMKILLGNRADINAKDNVGETGLMYAAEYGKTDVVKILLANGADINAKTDNGWTSLMRAARNGKTAAVKILLENGADINAKDNEGKTALDKVLESARITEEIKAEIAKILRENGGKRGSEIE